MLYSDLGERMSEQLNLQMSALNSQWWRWSDILWKSVVPQLPSGEQKISAADGSSTGASDKRWQRGRAETPKGLEIRRLVEFPSEVWRGILQPEVRCIFIEAQEAYSTMVSTLEAGSRRNAAARTSITRLCKSETVLTGLDRGSQELRGKLGCQDSSNPR